MSLPPLPDATTAEAQDRQPSDLVVEEQVDKRSLRRLQRGYLWTALVVLLLAGGTMWMHLQYGGGTNIGSYVNEIELQLQERERIAAELVADEAFLRQHVFGLSRLSAEDAIEHADRMLALCQEDFNVLLFEGDSLVLWTSNLAVLPANVRPHKLPAESLKRLSNGYYFVKRKRIELFEDRPYEAVTLIPIHMEYSLKSEYLQDDFVGVNRIPHAVEVSEEPTAFPVHSVSGKPVAHLKRVGLSTDWRYQLWMFGLHVMLLCLIGFGLFKLAYYASAKHGRGFGAATILSGAVLLHYLVNSLAVRSVYPDLGFVTQLFGTPVVGGSLASLIFNVLLAMWLVTFFHRSYHGFDSRRLSMFAQWGVTSVHYLLIIVSATLLAYVVERTIKSPGLDFDFSNVLNLSGISIVALIGLLTLVFANFLFVHRLMLGVAEIDLTRQARFTGMLAALAVATPVLILLDMTLPVPQFVLGLAIFMLVYDIFIDTGESNVLWLFFWLVVLSIYSALLFFTFNTQKLFEQRLAYAKTLSNPRDSLAEGALLRLETLLTRDLEIQSLITQQRAATNTLGTASERLARVVAEQAYLYHNYNFSVFGLPANASPAAEREAPQPEVFSLGNILARFEEAEPITTNLRLEKRDGHELSYLLRVPRQWGAEGREAIYLDFHVGSRAPTKFLSKLLIDEAYRDLRDLGRYEFAIYRNGRLVQAQGGNPTPNLRVGNVPPPGQYRAYTSASYAEIVYAGNDGMVVLIGEEMGGYVRPISLFSYLFVWCIILTLIMSLLNTWIDVLPDAVDISWVSKPDLKTKIQVGIIALVLLSFAMIGYVTVLYFHNNTNSYHDNRLTHKVTSVQENVEHEISLLSRNGAVGMAELSRIIGPISKIHAVDVNLFDLSGSLAATSEPEMYKQGVVAPKMGAYARQLLADRGISIAQQYESIGSLHFQTAYVPVRNVHDQVMGYLGLPYYSKQHDLRQDVSAFMGTLLNVYVFLLLIAGAIAISVANSITRPLTELGDKIRRFKVDERLKPLEWKANDELGDLIHEFNNMLRTVESSAKELDNARRESAWREMAQQVAHEIKNPLTPMKLSIEFLKHAFDNNPSRAQIEPLLQRVSTTLVEQIDNLASIATNFSMFARMPEPENTNFRLDDLVESVYNLFLEEDVESTLVIEPGDYGVFADKKLLMRVLNNIIKNALQAIPAETDGKLTVLLQRIDDEAVVCVGDNGDGIPVEMQEKVFFPKFTTKSSGSGLGLAICRDIIHAAHGRIYFETVVGQGTKFYVALPVVMQDADGAPVAGQSFSNN